MAIESGCHFGENFGQEHVMLYCLLSIKGKVEVAMSLLGNSTVNVSVNLEEPFDVRTLYRTVLQAGSIISFPFVVYADFVRLNGNM